MVSGPGPGVLRPVCEQDLPRIHQIAVAAWRPIFARYRLIVGEEMWQDLWGDWEGTWCAPSPERCNDTTLVTAVDGQVVGFATWEHPGDCLAEVGGNAVDPAFQGRGIGTAQIRAVIARLRQAGSTYATVHTGLDPAHGPARAEYRKAGLRLGVSTSEYYNYLEEAARPPVRSELTCRWAEPADAESVRQLLQQNWNGAGTPARQVLGDVLFEVAVAGPARCRLNELVGLTAATPPRLRVAVSDGRPIGAAVVDVDAARHLGTIESLSVHPACRDQGVGCALCADAVSHFRACGLRHARLRSRAGGVTERMRRLAWHAGLYRELPSIDYYMHL
ncbi:MAG: GNAT family N-acetyltransferase [Candidatus Latescibacterota bacterium]